MIKRLALSWILLLATAVRTFCQNCPNPNTDYLYENDCYEFVELPLYSAMDYSSASDHCVSRNKTLAVIRTSNQQQLIAEHFKQLGWTRALIGLRYQHAGWKWTTEPSQLLHGQGCYDAKEIDASTVSTQYSATQTPDNCIAFCSKARHTFAAVMASSFCYCSDVFIWTKPTHRCDLGCAGDANQTCGSYTSSYVYDTSMISFDNWQTGYPKGNVSCGAISLSHNNKWVDTNCTFQLPFLCRYQANVTLPTGRAQRAAKDTICSSFDDTCYYLYSNSELNWFDASLYCKRHGGNIATIDTPDLVELVSKMLNRAFGSGTTKSDHQLIWIGVNRFEWYWPDLTVPSFDGWIAEEEPVYYTIYECAEAVLVPNVASNDTYAFGWISRTCNDMYNSKNRLICSVPAKVLLKDDISPQDSSSSSDLNSNNNLTALLFAQKATEDTGTSSNRPFPWWGILIIVLACCIVVATLAVIILFCFGKPAASRVAPENKRKERRREAVEIDGPLTTGRNQVMLY